MDTYYRVTAYAESKDISAIFDAYGMFDKLWQFSAYLVANGFKIIEVGDSDKFLDGNIKRLEQPLDKIVLRACSKGMAHTVNLTIDGVNYRGVQVGDKAYVPNKNE